jgi:hypothetical protein
MIYLHFFAKIFLGAIAFAIVLMPISTAARLIAHALNNIGKQLLLIFLIITRLLFTYFYLFFSAYCVMLYKTFSKQLNPDWLIYIISAAGALLLFESIRKELIKNQTDLNMSHPNGVLSLMSFGHNRHDLNLIITISHLKGYWAILPGFILFTFYPEISNSLYFELPEKISELWLM